MLEGSLTRGAGEGKPLHAWMIAAAIALPGDDIAAARAAHVLAGALLVVALWDFTTPPARRGGRLDGGRAVGRASVSHRSSSAR